MILRKTNLPYTITTQLISPTISKKKTLKDREESFLRQSEHYTGSKAYCEPYYIHGTDSGAVRWIPYSIILEVDAFISTWNVSSVC